MEKFIDGKKYDTATATEIVSYDNGKLPMEEYEETLYKTKKGAFFLWKGGGAQSCMGIRDGNSSHMSSDIVALKEYEAREWLQSRANDLGTEEFERAAKILGVEILEA